MILRIAVVSAWILGVAIGIPVLLGLFVAAFISPGLGRTDTAEISAAFGIVALTAIGAIYTGILGVRGRLPGTSGGDGAEDEAPKRSGTMGKLFTFFSVVVASSAVAAIVAQSIHRLSTQPGPAVGRKTRSLLAMTHFTLILSSH